MADEQHEVRQISWTDVFSFTQVFKSRKLAMHPSKLILALVMLLLLFLGGFAMDRIWSLGGAYVNTAEGEIACHATMSADDFEDGLEDWHKRRPQEAANLWLGTWEPRSTDPSFLMATMKNQYLRDAFATLVTEMKEAEGAPSDETASPRIRGCEADADPDQKNRDLVEERIKDKEWAGSIGDAKDAFDDAIKLARATLEGAKDKALEEARKADEKATGDEEKPEAEETEVQKLEEAYNLAHRALVKIEEDFKEKVKAIQGEPIFSAFTDYQGDCLRNAVHSVVRGNITGGLQGLMFSDDPPKSALAGTGLELPADPEDVRGFLYYSAMSVYGVYWFFCEHWLFAVVYTVFALAIWSLFGGAIYRIAALHAAREEKASMSQALRFSAGKFLSFFMAPLIPIGAMVFFGLLLLAGGMVANLWGVGAIIVSVLFLLAILGGLAIAFLLFGLFGGGALMYPTIAVEGSDSFDAISRSYSYIFNRPWRAGVYALSALFHGTICYLMFRLFAFVALKATHLAVKSGIWTGGEKLSDSADKLDVMWTSPTFDVLHAPMSSAAMSTSEQFGANLITVWVYLVIGLVAAFLITYFISSTTVIYYLLRRKVDATDLDDVFIEEAEEEELPGEGEELAPEGPDEPAPEAEGDPA